MLVPKMVRKIVTIFLIFCLIYANFNMAIFGVISYAKESEKDNIVQSAEEEKIMNIEITEFCKNNMQEQEKEYSEKITLNLKNQPSFNEVIISDVSSNVNDGTVGSEEKNINTFYKNTKISKAELISVIGESGVLEIKYKALEQEVEEIKEVIVDPKQENIPEGIIVLPNEEENDIIVLPDETDENENGIILAKNSFVQINNNTEADDDGYITIVYPENVISIDLKIVSGTNKAEVLEIVNSKIIGKVEDLEEVNTLDTTKNILVKEQEKSISYDEKIKTPIYYTKTVAELGMDKTQISTSVENKVVFTVTLSTDKEIYDLYKNPKFIIELPSEIEEINIEDSITVNNKYFQVDRLEVITLENGNSAIIVNLKGEQTEYTKSLIENTQILIETYISTKKLIPNLTREVKLYYQNENAKTYDGIGIQENGIAYAQVNLVSNSEIIVETKAVVGENTVTSLKTDYKDITIEPNTYKEVQIIGTAINNTGKDIENALILGTATNIGQISGVNKIYYTENENATKDLNNSKNMWVAEYTPNAKKFLIVVDSFKQGQTVTFNYNMNLPEKIEEDIIHEVKFEVYNNQNVKTSKITIYQEAERFDIYADEFINASISFKNIEEVQVNEILESEIVIKNNSGKTLENIALDIDVPEIFEQTYIKVMANGQYIDANIIYEDVNQIIISDLNIEKDATIVIELTTIIGDYLKPSEKVHVKIHYDDKQAEISNKVKLIKPSPIEATITSNKTGEALQENETIQYKVTLKNNGQSNANVIATLPELNGIDVYKVETVNLSTGETTKMSSGSLAGEIQSVAINNGEVVEIYIDGVAKALKKDTVQTMYLDFNGDNVYSTTTNRLINKVDKKIEVVEEKVQIDGNVATNNSIKGIAWVDRNQNGQKDDNEALLKGVQAVLINTENSEEIAKEVTSNKGEYNFDNIETGSYIVEFKYNTNTLNVTEYKSENVDEKLDSDIINTTQSNKTIAKTEVIELTQGLTKEINAGFISGKEFDMSINKGITKVTVNNEKGTNTYDFNNSNMAKVEIEGQYLKGSLILVEYEIAVTNIGEVAGYAKLISDQIPEGMEFNSELNTNWYEENGILYSVSLADNEIAPGETEVIKLILTKEMTDDKIVSPLNTVKIEKTFNEYLIEEVKKENNVSEATIIISLTTGGTTYIWLAIIFISIILLGAFSVVKITNKSFVKIKLTERRKTHGK